MPQAAGVHARIFTNQDGFQWLYQYRKRRRGGFRASLWREVPEGRREGHSMIKLRKLSFIAESSGFTQSEGPCSPP